MPSSQFPVVPTAPTLAKISPANCRVYFDCNVTPLVKYYRPWLGWDQPVENGALEVIPGITEPDDNGNYAFVSLSDHEQYARGAGLTPTLIIYNQTANAATMWSSGGNPDALAFSVNRYQYDSGAGNTGADYMQAGDQTAQDAQEVKLHQSMTALAKLVHNDVSLGVPYVTLYGGEATDQYMPIIFDFESSKTFNGDGTEVATFLDPEEHLARCVRWREMLQTVRDIVGYSQQIFVYGWNGLALSYFQFADDDAVNTTQTWTDILAEEHAICRLLSGFIPSTGYLSDVELRNPNFWFQYVINADREIDEHHPQWRQSKIMFINPYYQPSSAASPYYGQLMPYPTWKRHIQFLVDRGWSMLLWIGDMSTVTSYELNTVRPYIDYLARFNK